jgi:hypothetical protein
MNNATTSGLNDGRRSLATRSFTGMAASIGEKRRRPVALRRRRLNVEVKLADQAGDR